MQIASGVGIDLGTTSVLVYVKGKGIILREPSVIAVTKGDVSGGEERKIEAVGEKASRMVGRCPKNMETIYPLRGGVIADFEYTRQMLQYFLRKSIGRPVVKPPVAVCVPCKVTDVERRAIQDACLEVGARSVHLIEEPMAAAMGCGIDVNKPSGSMVVDIGGGTADVAVISMGSVVRSESIRVAGDVFDEDIIRFVRRQYGVIIGKPTAEAIKIEVGHAVKGSKVMMEAAGKNALSGLPTAFTVTGDDVAEAIKDSVQRLTDAIARVLENTPPELAADVTEHGIVMTGGGSLLRGLDKVLERKCHIRTFTADDALSCVALGVGKYADTLSTIPTGWRLR